MDLTLGSVFILYALLAFSPTSQASATPVNLTIDDTNTTYWTWMGNWTAVTPTTPCPGCWLQPDASQAHNFTWHDGESLSGSLNVQGSAVYIYGIDFESGAKISFALDGAPSTTHQYEGEEAYVYDALLFKLEGLDSAAQHTVSWLIQKNDNIVKSQLGPSSALFDYAVITVDQAATSSSVPSTTLSGGSSATSVVTIHKSDMGVLVGVVVGGLGAIGCLCVAFILLCRRRRTSVPVLLPINAPQHAEPGIAISRRKPATHELASYPLLSALPASPKVQPGVERVVGYDFEAMRELEEEPPAYE
ncbi:hypothetical protein MVEN_00264000 [Mycena venus]|uniref:Uncharacterized protein n=1 Tax=Mycena venus TaxID=2733690 RepID=A0A8H7DBH9_9AGAR|nr:hypothetical protein MVEN_00264000 [Mycena venus]